MASEFEFYHIPVLFSECLEQLNIKPGGMYVDLTAGGGGHSVGIAHMMEGKGTLLSIDKDDRALATCMERRSEFGTVDWYPMKSDYRYVADIIDGMKMGMADGILADLGVSSHQIDTPERGFSYTKEGPLDMRMDTTEHLTAAIVVNTYPERLLEKIFSEYGEERHAGRIAAGICEARKKKPFTTTTELAEVIKKSMPGAARGEDQHPARRCFQAIRIEVNHELDGLSEMIQGAISRLNPGGRLCIISFHSLEDRIVKEAFRKAENPCTCPPQFPQCICGAVSLGKVITKKPIEASEEELARNQRSHSAKLRVFERNDSIILRR